jgi:hypothetical protein
MSANGMPANSLMRNIGKLAESTEFTRECEIRPKEHAQKVYKIPQKTARRSTFFGSVGREINAFCGFQRSRIVRMRYIFKREMQYRYSRFVNTSQFSLVRQFQPLK